MGNRCERTCAENTSTIPAISTRTVTNAKSIAAGIRLITYKSTVTYG
jgi:hypothetical protein